MSQPRPNTSALRPVGLPCWLLFAFVAVASMVQAQTAQTAMRPESACGPLTIRFSTHTRHQALPGPPDGGNARVYVVEDWFPPDEPLNIQPTIRVGMDGAWAGATHGNSYMYFDAPPGERHLCVAWQPGFVADNETIALYGFQAKAGQAYFFRVRMRFYGTEREPYEDGLLLEPLNPDEAQYLMEQYPLATARAHK